MSRYAASFHRTMDLSIDLDEPSINPIGSDDRALQSIDSLCRIGEEARSVIG